jgi:hypothetical protein
MRMKSWIAALFSVAVVGLAAEQALALFWKHKCCRGGTYICCRPYNAFSPVCFGSIVCDGCSPLQTASVLPAGCFPSFVPNGPHGAHMFGFNGYHGALGYGAAAGGPYMMSPEPDRGPAPSYQAPMPTPVPPNTSWYNPYNPAPFGVQPANYPAGYYPGYWPAYPMGYWTNAYAPSPYGSWGVPSGR